LAGFEDQRGFTGVFTRTCQFAASSSPDCGLRRDLGCSLQPLVMLDAPQQEDRLQHPGARAKRARGDAMEFQALKSKVIN
jgi:hypothetical protein